jgi:excisionase family DNA binding protein
MPSQTKSRRAWKTPRRRLGLPPQTFERLLTDREAGALLGLHAKTVQKLARTGELPAYRLGRYWRYRLSDLEAWVKAHRCGSAGGNR